MIRKKNEQAVEVRKNARGGEGEITVRHYFKPEEITAKTRLCAEMTLPAGASVGLHEHAHEDELYIVQRGRGVIVDGGVEREIEPGDAILTGKGASHSIRNTGQTDLVVTAVIMLYY